MPGSVRKNNNNKNTLAASPTKRGALQPQGSYTCLFQQILLHNESCEREAEWTDPHGPQTTATQVHQSPCRDHPCHVTTRRPSGLLPPPPNRSNQTNPKPRARAPNGRCTLQLRLNQSFACTPIFPTVLPNAKAKLLRRKPSILVAYE